VYLNPANEAHKTFLLSNPSRTLLKADYPRRSVQDINARFYAKQMGTINITLSILRSLENLQVKLTLQIEDWSCGSLALCWVYRKKAFAVSGSFSKALADLITNLHNSNKSLVQMTLLWNTS